MNLLKRKTGLFAGIVCMSFCALPAMAQTPPDGGQGTPGAAPGADNGGRQRGGPGGRFDPAEMRQRMMDRLKTELGTSDDEFKAIQPKIEKVMSARRDAGAFGGFGGPGGRRNRGGDNAGGNGGGNGAAPADSTANAPAPSPVQEKSRALRTLLENKDAKPDDIKAALAAVRDAKTKAKEDLTKAQEDLKGTLTQRQEAVLVMSGLLD